VNGQKSGFSGVGAVLALKHHLQPEEIASVSNCMIRSTESALLYFNLEDESTLCLEQKRFEK
jgi:hypothetical protein